MLKINRAYGSPCIWLKYTPFFQFFGRIDLLCSVTVYFFCQTDDIDFYAAVAIALELTLGSLRPGYVTLKIFNFKVAPVPKYWKLHTCFLKVHTLK